MKQNKKIELITPEDAALFQAEIADVRKLKRLPRYTRPARAVSPWPIKTIADEHAALLDSLSDHVLWEEMEDGEDISFLRPGIPRASLKKLRGGHWVLDGELDLHGLTSVEAKAELVAFLHHAKKHGLRCVRIIHGKGLGSKNREPVLKQKVRNWLRQRDEVLAFCHARPLDGGSGATLVILKKSSRPC